MSAAPAAPATGALPGGEFPVGATVTDTGTDFGVASEIADGMVPCLFDETGAETRSPCATTTPPSGTPSYRGVAAGQTYGSRGGSIDHDG